MGASPSTPRRRANRLYLWLLLFGLVNGAGVDLALTFASSESDRARLALPTTLHYTREYVLRKSSFDSWRPMRHAIEYLREDH